MTPWKTFWIGVAVFVVGIPITWLFDWIRGLFPSVMGWFGELMSDIWTFFDTSRPVKTWVMFLAVIIIVRLAYEGDRAIKQMNAREAARKKAADAAEAAIEGDEVAVVGILAKFDGTMAIAQLDDFVPITVLRQTHALQSLERKGFINIDRLSHVRTFQFTDKGREYAIKHDLDQWQGPPVNESERI